jgi:UDP-N-acetylglucosamine 1-carboxyvinyltransferase
MAAALLTDEPVTLTDVPDLADIQNMVKLMEMLGCSVQVETVGKPPDTSLTLRIQVKDPTRSVAGYDIVRTMRASICALGPLLAKRGHAEVSMPGGCAIGDRPVDLHLRGMEALGARVRLNAGNIVCDAPSSGKLMGKRVFLGGANGPTVLGTANVMSAAVLAEGVTIIESAACEPEVEDLANLLIRMGARIQGAGSPRITIEGVPSLHGATHRVIPDRIEAGTYIMASAITNGDITLDNCPMDMLAAPLDRLGEVGIEVVALKEPGHDDPSRQVVRVASARRLAPVQVVTQPYAGFPTDLQAQIMALLCFADGNSFITEKIYGDRFLHVAELLRMGAQLYRNGPSVLITGVRELIGAPVMASDLRASAGLVLAGLAARGETLIDRVYHLDRGYQRMEHTLRELGADIERIKGT